MSQKSTLCSGGEKLPLRTRVSYQWKHLQPMPSWNIPRPRGAVQMFAVSTWTLRTSRSRDSMPPLPLRQVRRDEGKHRLCGMRLRD
mmetsp:Transcript_86539/g.171810  ORF Transcript_86539/g.171810 Transcript_86539/m.171810 type:complete len:86 (+) Transcript_86539:224-481(+)